MPRLAVNFIVDEAFHRNPTHVYDPRFVTVIYRNVCSSEWKASRSKSCFHAARALNPVALRRDRLGGWVGLYEPAVSRSVAPAQTLERRQSAAAQLFVEATKNATGCNKTLRLQCIRAQVFCHLPAGSRSENSPCSSANF